MVKPYGLIFTGPDDKDYFYKSFHTVDTMLKEVDSPEFKAFPKKKIKFVMLDKKELIEIDKAELEELKKKKEQLQHENNN